MSNKKKIALIILLYLLGMIILIIGLANFSEMNTNLAYVLIFSGTLPAMCAELLIANMLPPKLKMIKYFLRFHAWGFAICFVIIVLFAIFSDVSLVVRNELIEVLS